MNNSFAIQNTSAINEFLKAEYQAIQFNIWNFRQNYELNSALAEFDIEIESSFEFSSF